MINFKANILIFLSSLGISEFFMKFLFENETLFNSLLVVAITIVINYLRYLNDKIKKK